MRNHILTLAAAAAIAALSASSVFADTVTAKIKAWQPDTMELVLESGEVFPIDTAKIQMPDNLQPGDTVVIEYTSNDNGVNDVFSVVKQGG